MKIDWQGRREEIQTLINEKGADHVCELLGVTRKHLLTCARANQIQVASRQKRGKAKERELPNDLPAWLIKRRNEHLRGARL